MKNILFLSFLIICTKAYSQKTYWQQQVNFDITVSLNDADNTLDGFERIEYINNSPDTLRFIWFHLWPNAYKNDRTAFSEQLLQNGRTDFYFSTAEEKGYINRLNFLVDGNAAQLQPGEHIDVAKLLLPEPLAPGATTIITTPFNVKLPKYFSRGGYIDQQYQVTQWYPKPAVYNAKGWHPMPYVDQGEFYSEFGNYDVQITLPPAYTVAASGQLQDMVMLTQLKNQGTVNNTQEKNTWTFSLKQAHDFAWFASKKFVAHYDTVQLASGKVVDIFSFYQPDKKDWNSSISYVKDGLQFYSALIGDYPYNTVSIVDGPENISSGGMEYPTITLITTSEVGRLLDATIVHEVGHNWFYGALANNERDHAWMDEGMNTYYQKRYELAKYGPGNPRLNSSNGLAKKLPDNEANLLLRTMQSLQKDEPIEGASAQYSPLNYRLSVYEKASDWMQLLQQRLGLSRFDSAMQHYYAQWKFRHPQPADFMLSIQQVAQRSIENEMNLLTATGPLIKPVSKRSIKPSFYINLNQTDKYSYINITPAVGYNNYDKFMPGLMVHNYQLPINKFNFVLGGLYGTGSKKLNTIGRLSYNKTQRNHDFEAAVSLMNFSQNSFEVDDNTTLHPRFLRVAPSLKFTFYQPDANYNKRFTVQLKSFFLKEDNLDFRTVITPVDTIDMVDLASSSKNINRLTLGYANIRVLYPYSLTLNTDQSGDFIRTGLTANYFFNYAEKQTGLKARFFAGKFFYLKSKTVFTRIATDRYNLNMTGPKGNEDYTYSNYFIGRNEFEGFMSQQIMERDGFFKVRTDYLSDKVGKTDDWLMSLNLVTDLPQKYNPLSVLPVKIPLKIFADVGTYADAWKNNPATGRFLYDAGLQVSLFKSLVNIYIPVLYSKVYRDYFKSTITEKRFLRNLSFSINIHQLELKNVLPGIPF